MTELDPFNQHPFHKIPDCWLPQPGICGRAVLTVPDDPYASDRDDGHRIDFERAPDKFFRGFIEILISGICPLNTRMKMKNLKTRMKTKILNLMNHQSPGVPLAIVRAVNQAQFFNVD